MPEDIGLFDALYSQRAIRYFKPDPVSDELIHKLIEAATKAPSGSNKQGWKFLVIRDQATKDIIGDYYKRGWEITWRKAIMWEAAYRGQSQSSFFPVHARRSSEYLARHIAESPVLIMACIDCIKHDGGPSPVFRGSSIYPAVQNLPSSRAGTRTRKLSHRSAQVLRRRGKGTARHSRECRDRRATARRLPRRQRQVRPNPAARPSKRSPSAKNGIRLGKPVSNQSAWPVEQKSPLP